MNGIASAACTECIIRIVSYVGAEVITLYRGQTGLIGSGRHLQTFGGDGPIGREESHSIAGLKIKRLEKD